MCVRVHACVICVCCVHCVCTCCVCTRVVYTHVVCGVGGCVCACHIFFVHHLLMNTEVVSVLAVVNNAAMNTEIYVLFQITGVCLFVCLFSEIYPEWDFCVRS